MNDIERAAEVKGFEMPGDLTLRGGQAAQSVLVAVTKAAGSYWDRLPYTGGCKTFYSPAQWEARGEEYGRGAVLIVVHDGGDLSRYGGIPGVWDRVRRELEPLGLYAEQCTGWSTAIYER